MSDPAFEAALNASLAAFALAKIDAAGVYPRMTKEYPDGGVFPAQLAYDEANGAYEQLQLAAMLVKERALKGAGNRELSMRPSLIALMRNARTPFSVRYGDVMPTWRHRVFADTYLAESEPAKPWWEDFDFFAAERRATLHDNSLMAPSLFLSGIGLSLIDLCFEADEKSLLARHVMAVWKAIFEATRLLFTHWNLSDDASRNLTASLFARYPACLRALSPIDSANEEPAQWLALLGRDEGTVANALANLLNNGMEACTICGPESAFEEMKRRMQNYLVWEAGAGSRVLNRGVRSYLAKNFIGKTSAPVAP